MRRALPLLAPLAATATVALAAARHGDALGAATLVAVLAYAALALAASPWGSENVRPAA